MDYTLVDQPPAALVLGRSLVRHNIRGGYKLLRLSRRLGLLSKVVRYHLSGDVKIDVPVFRIENQWDRTDLVEYETEMMDHLGMLLQNEGEDFMLVDCGADIGLFSAR